jgi:hypothetical protein
MRGASRRPAKSRARRVGLALCGLAKDLMRDARLNRSHDLALRLMQACSPE